MTAGERLQQLAGLAGVSAATMLLAIGTGATSGEALVDYSGIPPNTAAVHLLTDVAHGVSPPSGGAGGGGFFSGRRVAVFGDKSRMGRLDSEIPDNLAVKIDEMPQSEEDEEAVVLAVMTEAVAYYYTRKLV